jgi:ATP-dependent Clp protease ATP-binding subunit ClpA
MREGKAVVRLLFIHIQWRSQQLHQGRELPGKAVDVLDEAGSFVKLRQSVLPEELWNVRGALGS